MGQKLAMNTTVEGDTYKAGSVPPASVAKKITNPKAWGGDAPADDDTEGGEDSQPAYGDMKVEQLEAEVDARNADRDDDSVIEVTGTGQGGKVLKKDLVAALEADDDTEGDEA